MKRIAILSQKDTDQWTRSSRMSMIAVLWPEWEREPDLTVVIETPGMKQSMSALEAMLLLLGEASTPPEVRHERFAQLLLDHLEAMVLAPNEPTTPSQCSEP